MHYLDIVIVIIIVASAVEGGIQGFVYEVFSLLGLAAGLVLAIRYCHEWSAYLHFIGIADWLLSIITFLIIVIVVSAIFRMLGRWLRKLLSKVFMGWLDHFAGVLFGIVRGGVMVLLIVLLLLLSPLSQVIRREAPRTQFLKPAVELVKPFLKILTQDRYISPESV